MLKHKQIACIVVFMFLSILSYAESKGIGFYYNKLISQKKVDEMGSISLENGSIIIKGMVYDKIRIDRIYIQDKAENSGNAEIIFLVKDIEEAFLRKNKDIKTIKVTTTDKSLIAEGKAKVIGTTFKIRVEGFFSIEDGKINCLLTNAKLGYLSMPTWVVKKFNERINPFFNFEEFGLKVVSSKMIFEKSKIIIK